MFDFVTYSDIAEADLHIQLWAYRTSYADAAYENQLAIKNTFKRRISKNWILYGEPTTEICAAQSLTQRSQIVRLKSTSIRLTILAHKLLAREVLERITDNQFISEARRSPKVHLGANRTDES